MHYAVSYLSGRMVLAPGSTDPIARLLDEQFDNKEDAINRAIEVLNEDEYHCVLVHDENGLLYSEMELRRMA